MAKANAEAFSKAGDQFLGEPYSKMDCQQFVENCMREVGINQNLAGSNAWFRKMTWVGTPEECKALFGSIPKGALLYILSDAGGEVQRGYHDGLGDAQHIGIKTGRGKGAIHSSASKKCVCESEFKDKTIKNGGWNRIGLWDAFDYGTRINDLLESLKTAAKNENEKVKVVIPVFNAIVDAENDGGVNLRKSKAKSAKLLVQIPEGATVTVLDDDGTWSQIKYEEYTGYAMSKFLRPDDGATGEMIEIDRGTAERFYIALGKALYGEEGGAVG